MDIIPLTREQIAINEKKMNMTLDDLIKMNKKTVSKSRKPRAANKRQKFPNRGPAQANSSNVRRFRSSSRQEVRVQRGSNFHNNRFHSVTAIAKDSAPAPLRSRPLIRKQKANSSKPRIMMSNIFIKAIGGNSAVYKKTNEASSSEKQLQGLKVVTKQDGPHKFDSFNAYTDEQGLRTIISLFKDLST